MSNGAENTFLDTASGALTTGLGAAAMGMTGAAALPFIAIGGLLGLGKGLMKNKAAKKRERQVAAQKARLQTQKKLLGAQLTNVPALLEAQTDVMKENLDYEAQNTVDSFIKQTVGSIKSLEEVKGKTGLHASGADQKITSTREDMAKSFAQLRKDVGRKKEMMDYELEGNKAQQIQGILGEMYNIDTTIQEIS